MTLILNQAQAEAVYSAMCVLNNVDATVSSIHMHDEHGLAVVVHTTSSGMWMIQSARNVSEWHDSQSAFAIAYGLSNAEVKTDDAQMCARGAAFAWLPER